MIAPLGALALLLCVLAAMWPPLVHGFPHGADADFHATAWSDIAQQWKQGTVWPRWGSKFAYGFGEPVYIFYPPFSLALGALCTLLFGGGAAPTAFCFFALLLAGFTMQRCAREFTGEVESWIAACAYAANPYFLLSVWIRNSFAELLAAAILPLVVKYALRLRRRPDVAKLALAYAAIWMTNFPAAVIASYAVVILLVTQSIDERRWNPLGRGLSAIAVGAVAAGWMLVPAWYEQRWVQIELASTDYYLYWKHWLWGGGADPDDVDFTHWLTVVAAALIVVIVVSGLLWIARRRSQSSSGIPVSVLAVASSVLMFRPSGLVWSFAPLLSKVQFPWRWMFVVAAVAVLLMALAVNGSRWKFVAILVLLIGGAKMGSYLYDQADWSDVWSNQYAASQNYLVDEYLPNGADGDDLRQLAERHKTGVLDYPAWKWSPDSTVKRPPNHLLVTESKDINVKRFSRTWDRVAGGWVSVVGLLICAMLIGKREALPNDDRSL